MKRYSPLLGRSRQPMMFISVDLPDPEAPMMATNSPARMVRSTSRSTGTVISPAGYSRPRPFSSISGAPVMSAPISESHRRTAHRAAARSASGPVRRLSGHHPVAFRQALDHFGIHPIVQADADLPRLDLAVAGLHPHRL